MNTGEKLLERAKAHYAALDRLRVEVPEWGDGGKPVVITHTKLTVAERRRIYKPDGKGQMPDGMTVAVRAILIKACDENGRRLWDDMAEHDLLHQVDGDIVARIAGSILAGVDVLSSEELEAEKNG